MYRNMCTDRRGFALSDLLTTMICTAALVPIAVSCIVLLPQLSTFHEDVQDETALYQLRRIGMMAYDPAVSSDTLSFSYKDQDWQLSMVNRRLILQPGTQIFLSEIDSASFTIENGVIYCVYEREGKTRSTPLMHE
ncbi:MAG: hypothetical protein LKE64_01640 [Solobacterium sp.]|jgi:hypothetical protein|nr:hypothetical protein [Solobacterium sp.]MCH4049857.1 hypothetical protein [Solobacterium sp.]MCH4073542.1 hypothetical protein [Solobacterium sp.]MCI1312913.1 hypothetical protein [Solobacterium sp.]MCI1347189.1 hypothetical protein [Solobacterium sp.]